MLQVRVSDFRFIPRPLIQRGLKIKEKCFIRLASAFGGKGGKPPVHSGAACLHLQVEKGACSPALVVSSLRGYLVQSGVPRGCQGAAGWCAVLGRSWLSSMWCASRNTALLLKMVFLGERPLVYCV